MDVLLLLEHLASFALLLLLFGLTGVVAKQRRQQATDSCNFALQQLTDTTLAEIVLPLETLQDRITQLQQQLQTQQLEIDRVLLEQALAQCQQISASVEDLLVVTQVGMKGTVPAAILSSL
jgi:TolA-binding protein